MDFFTICFNADSSDRGWKAAPTIKPAPKFLNLTRMRRGGNNAATSFVDLVESIGADYVVPVMGEAMPFGPTEDSAFEYMSVKIVEAVKHCTSDVSVG